MWVKRKLSLVLDQTCRFMLCFGSSLLLLVSSLWSQLYISNRIDMSCSRSFQHGYHCKQMLRIRANTANRGTIFCIDRQKPSRNPGHVSLRYGRYPRPQLFCWMFADSPPPGATKNGMHKPFRHHLTRSLRSDYER